MSNWRHRLFGRNETNFWGWLVASLLIFGVVVVCGRAAARHLFAEEKLDAHLAVLFAILAVLTGQFGLALQEYYAKWIERDKPAP
jgi:drug/metabolite transporter (DMT)-like permease